MQLFSELKSDTLSFPSPGFYNFCLPTVATICYPLLTSFFFAGSAPGPHGAGPRPAFSALSLPVALPCAQVRPASAWFDFAQRTRLAHWPGSQVLSRRSASAPARWPLLPCPRSLRMPPAMSAPPDCPRLATRLSVCTCPPPSRDLASSPLPFRHVAVLRRYLV